MKKRRRYRYKVVTKFTNRSAVVIGNSKYSLIYIQNTIVKAVNGTLGIMTFKTRKNAQTFMDHYLAIDMRRIIKRVIPIGRGSTPTLIAGGYMSRELDAFYKKNNQTSFPMSPPEGTICYPAVEVID